MISKNLQDKDINFVLLEKGGKKPFQKDWTKKEIKYNDVDLIEHLNKGGNYGVMGGGKKNLVIVDFDNKELQEKLLPILPETFTTKTGSGLLHLYYFSNGSKSFKLFNEEMDTLADVQCEGKQVVGAGSIHPNGNKYEIIKDIPIAFLDYAEIQANLIPYDKKPKKEVKKFEKPKVNLDDDFIDLCKSQINISDVLSLFGVDTSKNPTECLFHSSKGGKCLGFQSDTAHCFHCDGSWNIFSLVMQEKNCDFKGALEFLADNFSLRDKLEETRKKYVENLKKTIKDEKEDSENQQTTIFRQLAKDFYVKQPYFYDGAHLWWLWNKNEFFWEVKDEIDIMNQFDKYFNQESEKSNIKSGIIEALKKYGRKHKPKEIKPTWIQFKKQIYDIENDNSFEATPEYFIANPIPWEVGDSEETPNIDKLFSSWVKEKDIPKLYELFSFPLIPEMFIHSFHFLYSAPGMGKSTYLNLLIKFIGRKNVVSTSINRINSNPRFETYNWNKKLLITLGEVSNINDLKNSGLINQATGGEPIRAEVKGGGGFDFVNYGKFIYPTNKLLKVDSDDGFGRRVRIIKFQTRFEKEKDILNSIPEEEFSNLSKKCLRIVKELYKKRRFTGDVSISERMNNYQEESKTILERFIDTFCDTTNFEGKILLDEFFSKYNSHLQINKETRVNKSVLAKELNKLGWETKRELVVSEQQSLGSFAKKELKSFVLGISKISPITPITPYFPLLPLRGSSEILPVIPVMPDISKEINTISKKEMLDFYKKQGLEEETKEILEESKW